MREGLGIKRGKVSVGHFVYIGPKVQIICPPMIADLTLIAADVHFVGKYHNFCGVGIPLRIAPPDFDALDCVTIVASEVKIGQRFTNFHGLKIGRGSVIAAMSVVTREIPKYTVVVGVPEKVIRRRFKSNQEEMAHIQKLHG